MNKEQRYYILEAQKGSEILRYSISALSEAECISIYNDFKDDDEFMLGIQETVSPFEWERSKLK